ncbi:hypothetical protein [Pseudomonas sp. CFBP 8772]|uniref:hypothetical protein n=1 Tax=Pseudomonas sp. CFBP 8772 TaxID=2775284 RepID=UPI001783E89A|nr:hypothetical protein [Pseudomonas sp. CFBP 8772]MBD8597557.1 hypothetical protein [Pseudomonas sp. CFBP 8772]
MSLTETDNINNKLVKNEEISLENAEFSVLDECLKQFLSKAVGDDYYLLIDEDWRYCGAYAGRGLILNMEFEFNKCQSDEVRLISADLSAEITIDYIESYNEKLFEFRLRKYELT